MRACHDVDPARIEAKRKLASDIREWLENHRRGITFVSRLVITTSGSPLDTTTSAAASIALTV